MRKESSSPAFQSAKMSAISRCDKSIASFIRLYASAISCFRHAWFRPVYTNNDIVSRDAAQHLSEPILCIIVTLRDTILLLYVNTPSMWSLKHFLDDMDD
jgi:hypothetical protein